MNVHVLIVDDSRILRRAIRKTVVLAGVPDEMIREAGNGREALDVIERECIDLVLLDLHMPVMDGEEFVKHVHGRKEFAHMPIIIVSTESNHARLERVLSGGAVDRLHKPFEPEELCRLIAKRLGVPAS